MIAQTPEPPYYAVIFTSLRTLDTEGYTEMAELMVELASQQTGFLGFESARDHVGITVSYWSDLASIQAWKTHAKHQIAQKLGQEKWYSDYKVRIARVEKSY
ncbi:MAG: antibiotic biosynthesis monooxygenase [Kangiellaceae bacterium]|nr:antibiotic biosynthesis monooxygenase [Kangiellaceae bacterium]